MKRVLYFTSNQPSPFRSELASITLLEFNSSPSISHNFSAWSPVLANHIIKNSKSFITVTTRSLFLSTCDLCGVRHRSSEYYPIV